MITRYKEAYTGDNNVARTIVGENENLLGVTFVQAVNKENATIVV